MVDKPLGAGLILVIVNMSLNMYYIHATIKKIKTYKHITILHVKGGDKSCVTNEKVITIVGDF